MRRLALILTFLACSCAWAQTGAAVRFAGTEFGADTYTTTLLHFDGNLTDDVGFTWTAAGGAVATTTAAKFGSGALAMPGIYSDFIYSSPSSASDPWSFGTGDFTIEIWAYDQGAMAFYTRGFILSQDDTSKRIEVYARTTDVIFNVSGFPNEITLTSASALPTGRWVHLAVSRHGTDWRMFFDGAVVASASKSITMPNVFSGNLVVGGKWSYGASDQSFGGYLDELRASKGIARYTANFSPPTAPFAIIPADRQTRLAPGGAIHFGRQP